MGGILMKLDNLEAGMVVKNYKDLCRLLDLKPTTGRGRQNQVSWIEDYVKYEKQGHKFVIKDVYKDIEIVPMKDNRGGDMSDSEHIEYIEKLILDLLAYNEGEQEQKGKGQIFLSKTKMFEALAMVNAGYGASSARTQKLSILMDMNELNIEEWFNSTSSMLERNLNKALNSLEKQYLIYWSKKIAVCKVEPLQKNPRIKNIINTDKYGEVKEDFETDMKKNVNKEYREATNEEIHIIIKTERLIMEALGCKNQQEIFIKGKWAEFQREVKNIILNEANIGFYWQSYSIIFNHENVYKESNSPDRMILTSEDEIRYQRLLNNAIESNVNKNTLKRSERSKILLQSDSDLHNQRNKRRSEDTYLHDSVKLGETLIRKDSPDITKLVKQTKISK